MRKKLSFRLLPSEAADPAQVLRLVAASLGTLPAEISGYDILKHSIDARGKQAWINLTVEATIHEPWEPRPAGPFEFRDVRKSPRRVIIVGAGPAGLFAALRLLVHGIKPIILERGKDVRSRRRDLAQLNKEGEVNPESNYCFGEGGAGTYSDGKLYTRSSKRGDVGRILNLFVHFGAEENIRYEAHPHIGTNKLPRIITAMREQIIASGGEVHFGCKLVDFQLTGNRITSLSTTNGSTWQAGDVILATGHSARDIFELLEAKKIRIENKPFALGVRAEHPQSIIDSAQYHCQVRDRWLPPAAYSLVEQVAEKGVFSFCMCPGGIIAPAATSPGELVVNGWSPSKRNNPFANSGIVVSVDEQDVAGIPELRRWRESPLLLMKFQQLVEQRAFSAGGGKLVAPAQRLGDFVAGKPSASLPGCSYLPGIRPVGLEDVLPSFIRTRLQAGFAGFGKKIRGYLTNEAVVVATESRTSSPVRIPRDPDSLRHPQIENLYPCGEGAGYAGGIVSAAMDGERLADQIHAAGPGR